MTEKRYTIRLSERELWALGQAYEANWTAPEERSELEVRISDKISRAHRKARYDIEPPWPPLDWYA